MCRCVYNALEYCIASERRKKHRIYDTRTMYIIHIFEMAHSECRITAKTKATTKYWKRQVQLVSENRKNFNNTKQCRPTNQPTRTDDEARKCQKRAYYFRCVYVYVCETWWSWQHTLWTKQSPRLAVEENNMRGCAHPFDIICILLLSLSLWRASCLFLSFFLFLIFLECVISTITNRERKNSLRYCVLFDFHSVWLLQSAHNNSISIPFFPPLPFWLRWKHTLTVKIDESEKKGKQPKKLRKESQKHN